jgi:hypothetical protein
MTKITFRVPTFFKKPRVPGETVDVDEVTAKRWIAKRIAEPEKEVGESATQPEPTPTPTLPGVQALLRGQTPAPATGKKR